MLNVILMLMSICEYKLPGDIEVTNVKNYKMLNGLSCTKLIGLLLCACGRVIRGAKMAEKKEEKKGFTKTDMERVALFQEMGYTTVGDTYTVSQGTAALLAFNSLLYTANRFRMP